MKRAAQKIAITTYLWHLDGVNWPGHKSRANLKNGLGSLRKYWMSNMACGSGRSGKSAASLEYIPSRLRKSGMPHDTETPAPVRTIILLQERSSRTTSDKVLTCRNFSLLGGSLMIFMMICTFDSIHDL